MLTYRQARRHITTAARVAAVDACMSAELDRARAHYEAVAAGTEPAAYGMTAERAAQILAAWDNHSGLEPDPPPAPVLPARHPWYMPPGASRCMSVRETVQRLNWFGCRVTLALQLLALLIAAVPATGPVDKRRRPVESFPRRIARELYAAAGVGPCWHDVYPRREVVSLNPP